MLFRSGLRRGARPAPTAVPGRRVEARQAAGAEARAPACNQGLAGATPLHGGRCVSTIDGEGPVCAGPWGGCAQVSPRGHQVLDAESLFEKYQAASRLSIKRVIATYTNVSLVLGNSS